MRFLAFLVALLAVTTTLAHAQSRTFKIDVTGGIAEPLPVAMPTFVAETPAAAEIAATMTSVIRDNLIGTGLFREISSEAYISQITSFNTQPIFADWRAINAEALVVGSVSVDSAGKLVTRFRLWDVFAQSPLGDGLQFAGTENSWRRIAHKVADAVYARMTGETGYFDSRIVFVAESGPKDQRIKRLAVMDQDGANLRYLTDGGSIVLAPRFSPNAREVLYTSYASGSPRVRRINVDTAVGNELGALDGQTFSPRYGPDGQTIILSQTQAGNTDIFSVNLKTGARQRLTQHPGIDTAPSFSPDGSQIVFESDRGGTQQIYVMPVTGGEPKRISFGQGRYGTPAWSPRGDMVAFTKILGGRFHIGVMRLDGSQERLLTASFHDEGPTWAPNGRVLMFFRETPGATGTSQLYSVDVAGRNLKLIQTPQGATDPSWSKLLP